MDDEASEDIDFFGNLLEAADDADGNFFLGFSFCCTAAEACLLEIGFLLEVEEDATSFITTSCFCGCFCLFDFVGNIGFLAILVLADEEGGCFVEAFAADSTFLVKASLTLMVGFLEMGVGPPAPAPAGVFDEIGFTAIFSLCTGLVATLTWGDTFETAAAEDFLEGSSVFFGAPTDGGGITGLTGTTLPLALAAPVVDDNGGCGLLAEGAGAGAGFVVDDDGPIAIAPFLLFTVGRGLGTETLLVGATLGRGGAAAPTFLSENFGTSIGFGLGVG